MSTEYRREAKYPFLESAQEAVANEGLDLASVASEDDNEILNRAVERVESVIREKSIGSLHEDYRVELLSYPMARVLVSLLDEQSAIHRYAKTESKVAFERMQTEEFGLPPQKSPKEGLTVPFLLEEFGIREDVDLGGGNGSAENYVELGTYLKLAANQWGDEWSLVNRGVEDGMVEVKNQELQKLVSSAIEDRIKSGLPFDVPDAISRELDEEVEYLKDALRDTNLLREVDTVAPDLFPPCMQTILTKIQDGENLEHHARFAVTAFLANIGMSTDEIVELYKVNSEFGEEITRYQTDHIQGNTGAVEYSPPSCATMKSYGNCYNPDETCETISHPMSYYERVLDEAEEDDQTDLQDWREQQNSDGAEEDGEESESEGKDSEEGESGDGANDASDTTGASDAPDADDAPSEESSE